MTGLHADFPTALGWMQLIEGRKRWYLLPPGSEVPSDWINAPHVFLSQENIAKGWKLGLVVLDIEAADLLCFPTDWYHEVHNLSPGSVAITNAVPMPEKEKVKKKDPKNLLGKRTLGENLAAFQLISTRADKKQRDLTKAFNKALLVAAHFPHSQDSSESYLSEPGVIQGGVKYAAVP